VGKAFRNEITAGNFIFRDLEFEQMELEYFIRGAEWEKWFDYWREKLRNWLELIGINRNCIHEREHAPEERSHYSKKTVDIEYDYPFGRKELWGLAYRTDYDLRNHSEKSGISLAYRDDNGAEFFPHVIEPSLGVERTMLAVLCSAYFEDEKRVVLRLSPRLAPYKVAIFPLVANKLELIKKAQAVFQALRAAGLAASWDDRGNIGKRYYAQDEIGTPWCVTVDYQTLEDNTVTVRDRDTTLQERVGVAKLEENIKSKLNK
jgi:glycyl-tRNA synthetase